MAAYLASLSTSPLSKSWHGAWLFPSLPEFLRDSWAILSSRDGLWLDYTNQGNSILLEQFGSGVVMGPYSVQDCRDFWQNSYSVLRGAINSQSFFSLSASVSVGGHFRTMRGATLRRRLILRGRQLEGMWEKCSQSPDCMFLESAQALDIQICEPNIISYWLSWNHPNWSRLYSQHGVGWAWWKTQIGIRGSSLES